METCWNCDEKLAEGKIIWAYKIKDKIKNVCKECFILLNQPKSKRAIPKNGT